MKTAKEFIERLSHDEGFAKQVSDGIQAKKDAGASDYTEALLPVAAELGYEITEEQGETLLEKQSEEISEEELGRTAGGTSCLVFGCVATIAVIGGTVGVGYGVQEAISSSSC